MVPGFQSGTESIHTQLKTRHHGVTINKNWISGLLRTGACSTADQIYKKWLTTDICETGGADLPPEVTSVEVAKFELPGPYTFQVQSVLNVGSSFYSQLKKLSGKELPEPTQNTQFREPPPSRMLFLTLTDGINVVNAMEYRPCSQLSTSILPGTKLLVCNITARIGVLLLEPGNLRVLGGCVESLRALYTQERVLRSALDEDGEGEEEGTDSVQTNITAPASVSTPPRQHAQRNNNNLNWSRNSNTNNAPHQAPLSNTPTANYQNATIANRRVAPQVNQQHSVYTTTNQCQAMQSGAAQTDDSVSHVTKRLKSDTPPPAAVLKEEETRSKPEIVDDLEYLFEPIDESFHVEEDKSCQSVPIKNLHATQLSFPVKITATISSLGSKLLPTPEWTVQAKLTDYSGTSVLRLSEQLLSKMIGFTSSEFQQLKPVSATNQSIKSFLRKGLECCQSELAFLTGVFTVQLNTINKHLSPFEVTSFEKLEVSKEKELREFVMASVNAL